MQLKKQTKQTSVRNEICNYSKISLIGIGLNIKFTEIYRNSISQHEENFAHFKEMLLASPLPFALAMEMKNCKCPS